MDKERDPIADLGISQRLVKRWRLSAGVENSYRHGDLKVRFYVEPSLGIFYTRIPETDEGTLYASLSLVDLRIRARVALQEYWHRQQDGEANKRAWERRIRICYNGGLEVVGKIITAEPVSPVHLNSSWRMKQAHDAVPCTIVGTLTFARYERAIQPSGNHWDEREWQEDLDSRLAFWKGMGRGVDQDGYRRSNMTLDEHRRAKPERGRKVTAVKTDHSRRDLPWSPETWERLSMIASKFDELHTSLREYLIESEEVMLLDSLAVGPALLTTRRTRPPART